MDLVPHPMKFDSQWVGSCFEEETGNLDDRTWEMVGYLCLDLHWHLLFLEGCSHEGRCLVRPNVVE